MNRQPLPGDDQPPVHPSNTGGPAVRLAADRPQLHHLVVALARALGSVTLVVVVYYLLPLGHPFGWRTVLALLGGLVFVALLTAWQVRSVLRSPHPGLRAGETLAVTVSLFLVLFAAGYQVLSATDASAFSEPLSRTDALYFVITVFATVGFGDISPVTVTARVITSVQMLGNLVLLGLVVKAMFSAVERGRANRGHEARSSENNYVEPVTSR